MEEQILDILAEANDELLTYTGDNMLDDGIVNSFSFIAMVSDLEDALGIEIDEELLDAEHFGNKDRIITTIKALLED